MNNLRSHTVVIFVCLLTGFAAAAQTHFTNPLLPSGADPWVIEHEGVYYLTHTTGRNLVLYKTSNIGEWKGAKKEIVWQPPQGTAYSKQLWAPELHYINKKWYFYFAADDGKNKNHRLYVLENASSDPMKSRWIFKGKLAPLPTNGPLTARCFNTKVNGISFGRDGKAMPMVSKTSTSLN